jgi:hypothetical protein
MLVIIAFAASRYGSDYIEPASPRNNNALQERWNQLGVLHRSVKRPKLTAAD